MIDRSAAALIRLALKEDLGRIGDITSRVVAPHKIKASGWIVAKEKGVVSGLNIAKAVFRSVSPRVRFVSHVRDGAPVRPGQKVASISGPQGILTAERTALNFLQHLSGIATQTNLYVRRLAGTRCRLLDTRKTLPGWRSLEKYAVRCGGGNNLRMGLYDAVLIKDNHLAELRLQRSLRAGRSGRRTWQELLAERVRTFKRKNRRTLVIIEAKNTEEVDAALMAGADIIMLDNMPIPRLRREIARIRARSKKTLIEVSGGVNLSTVRKIAKCGVDRISVGRITHSAPALDFSLELASSS